MGGISNETTEALLNLFLIISLILFYKHLGKVESSF